MANLDYWEPAKIFLAARFPRKEELKQYREDIQKAGHICTSSWLDTEAAMDLDMSCLAAAVAADTDLKDLLTSDVIVAFTEEPTSTFPRGARHVELGISIGLRLNGVGPTIFTIGPAENIYHNLPEIDGRFLSWPSFMAALQDAPLCHGESRDGRWCGLHPWHKATHTHRAYFPHPLAGQEVLLEAALDELRRWEEGNEPV